MKKYFLTALVLLCIFLTAGLCTLGVYGQEVTNQAAMKSGSKDLSLLHDETPGNYTYSRVSFSAGEAIEISHSEEITGIYIIWHNIYGQWSLTSGDKTQICGTNGFLHEYVEIEKPSTEVKIILPDKSTQICELRVFTEGELPDWVQVWNPPCEKADLMLLSTHSDDEHLFFAGVIPTYAVEKELKLQVVYMTSHWDTVNRPHEQINGLWAVGLRNYPIVGPFPDDADTLSRSGEAVSATLERSKKIFGEQKLIDFQVEMIDRFKPQVIVAHDIEGEYHHGAHMANTWSLQKALEIASWDVPKTYIHLWSENKVKMNWDQPLSKFNGMTAYEVSKLGYECHKSQHWTWFTRWLKGDGINKASDIKTYSPCDYGLYRTTVGPDTGKNDFMENITPYQDPTPEPEPTPVPETSSDPENSPPDQKRNNNNNTKTWIAVILLVAVAAIIVYMYVAGKKTKG